MNTFNSLREILFQRVVLLLGTYLSVSFILVNRQV